MSESPSALTRRREVGSASARSLLLTILGEFALPRSEPVWTATVLDALSRLGVEQRAARQALARTSAEDLLASERHGRRTAWSLTPRGAELLAEGTTRIYGFLRSSHVWDSRWLVLTVSIPESQRRLRHRLRTRLTWLGMGSPYSGLWVSPDAEKVAEVDEVITELGLGDQSVAWVGPTAGIGNESLLVDAAWDLAGLAERYRVFLATFSDRRADSADEAFTAQVELVQEWRRFPFLDPDLPRELLDDDWPGRAAADVFHARHAAWHAGAQEVWARLQAEASDRI
ncbi:PaaX family transcriptional regulator C-terminal domain-containing protein [uncultured Nocardioides sp.]|uniref:PaaX family transcriptional regulator n=1 Tax=uncultured Nocardioides sp. TaxID=198441 RepID=UPI00263162FB|nr:PaaX family transcriptional regulator C-terminal domain-containing protein [uncultured Nocardioides sp.]